MVWTTIPCTSGQVIRATWFDEIRAAIQERDTAVGTSYAPADVASKDLIRLRDEYRTAINNLIPEFYVKAGSHPNVTMTAYSKAAVMTECFGGGVVDWPNLGSTLLRAQDFNDMRTVLNKLTWILVPSYVLCKTRYQFYDFFDDLANRGTTAAAAQAKWDAETGDSVVFKNPDDSFGDINVGITASYGHYPPGGPAGPYLTGREWSYRDVCGILRVTTSGYGAAEDAVIRFPYRHQESPANAAESNVSISLYSGIDEPTYTESGIRDYGDESPVGSLSAAGSVTGYFTAALDKDYLQAATYNYLRGSGRTGFNGEITTAEFQDAYKTFRACWLHVRFAQSVVYWPCNFVYKAA